MNEGDEGARSMMADSSASFPLVAKEGGRTRLDLFNPWKVHAAFNQQLRLHTPASFSALVTYDALLF